MKTIEERVETNIVAFLLHLLQVANAIGAACDIALEIFGRWRIRVIDMDALEVEFLLEIVMLVNANL